MNLEKYDRVQFSKKMEEIEKVIHLMIDYAYYDNRLGYLMSFSESDYRVGRNEVFNALKVLNFFKNNKICNFNFVLSKNDNKFMIEGASSGESHFLANMLFLYKNLSTSRKNIVLIDEPEISLHPKWQRDYVLKLYDYFYKHDCKFFLATHSPLIISKVQTSRRDTNSRYIENGEYKIFNVKNEELTEIREDEDYSIESLYWEVFGVLTPDNAFLSRHCVNLLDEMPEGKRNKVDVIKEFNKMIDSSDSNQKDVLKEIRNKFLIESSLYD